MSNDKLNCKRIFTDAIEEAFLIIDRNFNKWGLKIPDMSNAGVYRLWSMDTIQNADSWRMGFGVGIPWLCWQYTGDEHYRDYADKLTDIFCGMPYIPDQCQGVLYLPSCVSAYKATGNSNAKQRALGAADVMMKQFTQNGNYFMAYKRYKNYVADTAFNTVLLHWASDVTGDGAYYEAAKLHLETEMKHTIRPDGSTCHVQWFDDSGTPLEKTTAQGYSFDSCWARGQAWTMLGFALHYRFTKNPAYLDTFRHLAEYFFANLNPDHISCWDLIFRGANDTVDTAASVIAVCAVLEMAKQLPDDTALFKLKEKAVLTMLSIIRNYSVSYDDYIHSLILGGVDNMHHSGENQGLIYGDYFYLEALVRLLTDFETYWQ